MIISRLKNPYKNLNIRQLKILFLGDGFKKKAHHRFR